MKTRLLVLVSVLVMSAFPISAFADGASSADVHDDQFHEQMGQTPGTTTLPASDVPFIEPPPATGQDMYVPPPAVDGWQPPVEPLGYY
jgi:hypothetical protein